MGALLNFKEAKQKRCPWLICVFCRKKGCRNQIVINGLFVFSQSWLSSMTEDTGSTSVFLFLLSILDKSQNWNRKKKGGGSVEEAVCSLQKGN